VDNGSTGEGLLRLDVVAGNASGFAFDVSDRLVIGRSSEGPGRLADDPELSRHHAQITRDATGDYTITDLSSSNGTFVNGVRLDASMQLSPGDSIEVGGTTLVVREVVRAPATPTAAVDERSITVATSVPEAPVPASDLPPAESAAEPTQPTPEGLQFELRISIGAQQGDAEIVLPGGEPLHLRLEDGRWNIADGSS
jgi:pSer/pThr/pTyr-binding forkhead associated (FHA) protein